MKKLKLTFVTLFILCSVAFFFYTVEQDQAVAPKAKVSSSTVTSSTVTPVSTKNAAYYMQLCGNQVIVYQADQSIFEYTDVNLELLPSSVKKELKTGKQFDSEEELYEFLETYTS
jgi:ABC-type phosphate transport system substrate-binding protein